ncbi:MAG: hypothetical protein C0417_04925 [Chlorobiaceae bacterium]|nr:hypothetical protein [Chlorobiaceae bacterium]
MKRIYFSETIKIIGAMVILFTPMIKAVGGESNGVAIVKKAYNDVQKETLDGKTEKAQISTPLFSEDKLKTGRKAFALVKFTEDNSIIRMREQAVLTIKSGGLRNSTMKEAFLEKGGIGFDVSKQRNNQQFQLTSPTSVASIRGTKGKWCRGEHSDTLILIEGKVLLRNRLSNNEVEIEGGFIGFSNDDGTIEKRGATDGELADAVRFASTDESSRQIKIEMKDPKGTKKTLKLDYKE